MIVAALGVLLGLQGLLADRERLATDAHWRPLLEALCTPLPCTLPAWREPARMRMLAREVSADPARPGLLRIHARFRNEARWEQPWPLLQVTLADASGQRLASRILRPAEYRGEAPSPEARLAPGEEAAVVFDVVEPAGEVVAFSFAFH